MEFGVFVSTPRFDAALEQQVRGIGTQGASIKPSNDLVIKWVQDLIKVTKDRLQRSGINASNQLSQSISIVPIDLSDDKLTIGIEMAGYWKFVDLGVKGAKSSERASNSPFQYRQKMPPRQMLEQWIAFKAIPLEGRDKQAANRSLAFLIARSIRDKGVKATRFFSDSLTEDKMKVLTESIADTLSKQIAIAINL